MNPLEIRIFQRLLATGGWLAFDEFMAMALYEPGLGYYSHDRQVFGRFARDGSDFVTAPELSHLFGATVARQIDQALLATGVHTVIEFGAGSGALAEQILEVLQGSLGGNFTYQIVEVSGSLRKRQQDRLSRFGGRVQWLDALPGTLEAVVLGNEVLDAMPVKLLHWDGAAWLERGVRAEAEEGVVRFFWEDRATALRPPYDHGQWVAGTVTEIHPHARAWVSTVGERLRQGAVFLFDYGFGDAEYYHPQRIGGTLMCHQLHRADPDPLSAIGLKDITSHVNFTSIALAGQDAGMQVLGYTTQARFLLNCGMPDLLSTASVGERNLAMRLINEHEMGELFKVIGFCDSNHGFEALGFRDGDRSHRL